MKKHPHNIASKDLAEAEDLMKKILINNNAEGEPAALKAAAQLDNKQ